MASKKAINDEKHRSELVFRIGLCHEKNSDFMNAIICYEKCIHIDQTHFRASLNLALLLQKFEQDLRAFKYYKNALRIRPYSVEALYGLTILVK